MTFEERIKKMSHKELQNFIYWVYQNGWEDHSNGCEDSPGDWSFFGGAILKYPADKVVKKLDEYYGDDWRDEQCTAGMMNMRNTTRRWTVSQSILLILLVGSADQIESW